jgi:tetratricopeptide (TPR) repeat protein
MTHPITDRSCLAVIAFALALSAATPGCGTGDTVTTSKIEPITSLQAKQPPALPDLSPMAPTAQQQLREQHLTLIRLTQDPVAATRAVADAYGDLGTLLMAAESFEEAESYLLTAQQLAPDEVRWPYYLGHLARIAGQSDKAVSFFERTLQIRPDDLAATIWLANVYLDQGRPELAEALFSRVIARQPHVFAARFGLGRAALAQRNFTTAVEQLEAAHSTDGRASIVHYPLALAYRGLGKTSEAESHLRQRGSIDVPPPDPLMQEVADALSSPVVYERRGDRAIARADFTTAEAAFRRGLELAPERLALRQKLATALALSGDVPAAFVQYEELLRRDPDFAEAHYSLGVLFLGNGRRDLAIERFAAAVRADPTYLQARLQLANALRPVDPKAAMREYTETLRRDPRMGEARFGFALALVRLDRQKEARDWLVDAMRLSPDQLEFVDLLARLLAASSDDHVRDGARAQMLAEELVARSPTSNAHEVLAMALAESGSYDAASQQLRDAIAMYLRQGNKEPTRQMSECLRHYARREPCRTLWVEEPAWQGP